MGNGNGFSLISNVISFTDIFDFERNMEMYYMFCTKTNVVE